MTHKSKCQFCGGEIEYTPIVGLTFDLKPTVCNSCAEKHRKSEVAQMEASRFDKWKRMTPPLYHDTDLNHPSMPSPDKQAQILTWKFDSKGLVIHGEARRGKSRLAWLLIKRLVLDGMRVEAMTSVQFADDCAAAHGFGDVGDWKNRLEKAHVLFIDDLGKLAITERVASDLFDIIDRRCSALKPLIFTTNFSAQILIDKFGTDRGPAIVGRIREFCHSVKI